MGEFRKFRYDSFATASAQCRSLIADGATNVKLVRREEDFVVTAILRKAKKIKPLRDIPTCCALGDSSPSIHLYEHPEDGCLATWGDSGYNGIFKVISMRTRRFRVMTADEIEPLECRFGQNDAAVEELACILFVNRWLKDAAHCKIHTSTPFQSWIQARLAKLVGKAAYQFETSECVNFYGNFLKYHRILNARGLDRDLQPYFFLVAKGVLPPETPSARLWRHYVAFSAYKKALVMQSNYEKCVQQMVPAVILGSLEARAYFDGERGHLLDNEMADLVGAVDKAANAGDLMDISELTPYCEIVYLYDNWTEFAEIARETSTVLRSNSSGDDSRTIASSQQSKEFESDWGDVRDDYDGGYYESTWSGPDDDVIERAQEKGYEQYGDYD